MRRLSSLPLRQPDLTYVPALHRDPKARSIYAQLFLHASQPYVHMLVKWVSTGHLSDKHEEFLVKETTSISKQQLDLDFTDEYWERRYTVGLALHCFLARSILIHFPCRSPSSFETDRPSLNHSATRRQRRRTVSPLPVAGPPAPPTRVCQEEPASPISSNRGSTRFYWLESI